MTESNLMLDSNPLLRALLNTTHHGICVIDIHGNILLSNEQLIGWTGHVRLQHSNQLWPKPHELILLKKALNHPKAKRGDLNLRLSCAHGGTMPVEVRLEQFTENGQSFFVLLLTDLRKDLQWESTLSSAQYQHTSLLNAVSTGIAIVREDTGEILQKNEAFGQWYGLPGEGLVAEPIQHFFVETQTWSKIRARLQRSSLTGIEMTAGVYNPDRTHGFSKISAQQLHFDGYASILLSFEDITEFQQVKKELKTANQLLNAVVTTQAQFVSDIDAESLFQHILNHVFELSYCRFGCIITFDPQDDQKICVQAFDNKDWNVDTISDYVNHRMTSELNTWFREDNTFFSSLTSGTFRTFMESAGNLPYPWLKNFASVALFSGREKVGMLGIGNYPVTNGQLKSEVFTQLNPLLVTLGNTIKAWASDQSLKAEQNKRLEQQLEAESLYTDLKKLIQYAAAPVFSVNKHNKITDWNQSAERLTGFAEQDVAGKTLIYQVIAPKDHSLVEHSLKKVFSQNMTAPDLKLSFKTPQGIEQVLCSFTPRHNQKGEIIGAWGISQNIMALADYQERLEKDVKAKTSELQQLVYTHAQTLQEHKSKVRQHNEQSQLQDRFIALASHEFRGPLSAILMTVENLENHYQKFDREAILSKIKRIRERSQQLHNQAHDILFLTQLDSETVRFRPVPGDVEFFCLDIAEKVMAQTKHTHAIEVHLCPLHARLDPQLMTRVLTNLLENAIKYSPEAQHVDLFLSHTDEHILFKISDSGIGILPTEREDIFKPFYRSERVVSKTRGSGLGLELVQRSVHAHGGSIDFTSGTQGTCFTVSIPYRNT